MMEMLTTIFDCCLYLAGLALALVVALFIVVSCYELVRTVVKNAIFEKRMRRRMKNA